MRVLTLPPGAVHIFAREDLARGVEALPSMNRYLESCLRQSALGRHHKAHERFRQCQAIARRI